MRNKELKPTIKSEKCYKQAKKLEVLTKVVLWLQIAFFGAQIGLLVSNIAIGKIQTKKITQEYAQTQEFQDYYQSEVEGLRGSDGYLKSVKDMTSDDAIFKRIKESESPKTAELKKKVDDLESFSKVSRVTSWGMCGGVVASSTARLILSSYKKKKEKEGEEAEIEEDEEEF